MAWLICGTIPDAAFPLERRVWTVEEERGRLVLAAQGQTLSVQRGTAALMATTVLAARALGLEPPETLLVGDVGNGEGSRALYRQLAESLAVDAAPVPQGFTFHYLYPDVDGHNRVLMAIDELNPRPLLVADAGFMYVAKMSGYAASYDVFTPDAGEMAFLADEMAPHPFYTRGFLLATEEDIPALAARAHEHENSARYLLVKGRRDHVVAGGRIIHTVDSPMVETMEPIGGTGDMVTGLLTALLMSGMDIPEAAVLAARTVRTVGELASPTPATQVAALLPFVGEALEKAGALSPQAR